VEITRGAAGLLIIFSKVNKKRNQAHGNLIALQRIDKVDALPSKACKQSFDGCINLL